MPVAGLIASVARPLPCLWACWAGNAPWLFTCWATILAGLLFWPQIWLFTDWATNQDTYDYGTFWTLAMVDSDWVTLWLLLLEAPLYAVVVRSSSQVFAIL